MLELMIVLSVSLILAAVADVTIPAALRQVHVDQAYNTTLMALRRAHDQAAADMRIYTVTFTPAAVVNPTNGGTITVQQDINGALSATPLFTATLPVDVTFHVEPGVPISNTVAPTTPDGFGTAANGAFDFDWGTAGAAGGGNTIYFYPDGSAKDANGNVNNGVVYLGVPGQLPTCRAITLWGYTGRVRGWQLYKNSGAWTWSQK
jgi:type II secretory pathway pseudopilin PulG